MNMVAGRAYHTATLLPNGKVLVAGGCYDVCRIYNLSSAELYDPFTGTWSATSSMANARAQHTATLLPNGKVLVAGGISGSNIVASAEIYDPATGAWSPAGNMVNARRFAQATLLSTGKVLVAGGQNYSATLAAAEIYDPALNRWSKTGSMSTPRLYFVAVPLLNGKSVGRRRREPECHPGERGIIRPDKRTLVVDGQHECRQDLFYGNCADRWTRPRGGGKRGRQYG
jgi:hypothetical protein